MIVAIMPHSIDRLTGVEYREIVRYTNGVKSVECKSYVRVERKTPVLVPTNRVLSIKPCVHDESLVCITRLYRRMSGEYRITKSYKSRPFRVLYSLTPLEQLF